MTNEVIVNKIDCFQVDGDESNPVSAQSILPDISSFQLITISEVKNGEKCQKWQKTEQIGEKVNKYTVWLKYDHQLGKDGKPLAIPVHYEMKGFNTLFGSHYDHYYIRYHDFRAEVLDHSHVFDIFLKKDCHGWPGPGMDHTYTMNPIREFIDNHDAHVTQSFEDFKQDHGRNFDSEEHQRRLEVYRQNLRFIHSKNRAGLTYSLASNHLADRTEEERRSLRGRTFDSSLQTNGGLAQHFTRNQLLDAPDNLDWR